MKISFLDEINVHPNYTAQCIVIASGNSNLYTRYDGSTGNVSSFMNLPELREGYAWYDDSPLGCEWHHWVEKPSQHLLQRPDTLFGYPEREFMARQYK